MSKAITFGHGGGRCPTRIFFANRHLTITEYTDAIGKRIANRIVPAIDDDSDDDVCPTCCQGDYKKHMPGSLPPDCGRCYKWVCTRCGILDNVNSAEANGYYCVHCYRPELINIDYGSHTGSDDDSELENINGMGCLP